MRFVYHWLTPKWASIFGALSLLASASVMAHPHGWIDISVRILTDDEGRVTGLHQTWQMDPFYSLVVFDELQRVEGATLDEGLDQLGGEIRNNLASQGYFTEVRVEGERLPLGEVREYTAMQRDDRLTFIFILPFSSTPALSGSTLTYQVYDPTYYLEVVHEAEGDEPSDDALVLRKMPQCELSVLPADPDPERVMAASRLDADESGEPGLGRYFAETGRVVCP
ncbi:ABC-type uncharacterized transport system, substrate-binding protein [Halomonas sp. HL-93]|nr:MAG: ABC-type uncharacterized transport system, periplasmic component [Halomonas sp. HL-93]SBR46270.1 ABC-type uncharacterized transport system, substrate-binding protein [Halomonas sp. HL-93]SNY98667.1 ABC-type uncharacterized transport system, substrate-binding protein [Halomonas sp. hl-4]